MPLLLREAAHREDNAIAIVQSTPAADSGGPGTHHGFGTDATMEDGHARAVDAACRKHVSKRPIGGYDMRGVTKRPTIDLIVGAHFRVGLCVAVMERYPCVVPP